MEKTNNNKKKKGKKKQEKKAHGEMGGSLILLSQDINFMISFNLQGLSMCIWGDTNIQSVPHWSLIERGLRKGLQT